MMIIGLTLIAIGIGVIVFRKSAVKQRFDFNTRLFGTKFSPAQAKYGEIIGFIVGIGFVVFGILAVLGLVKFK